MNKRQAKKAFKKKYGCTPNQVLHILGRLSEIDWSKVTEKVYEGVEVFAEALTEAYKKANMLIVERIAEAMKAIREGESHNP